MSYRYTTEDGNNIFFIDERSFLNARLNWMDFPQKPAMTFLQFIQQGLYNKDRCEVEDISPLEYTSSSTNEDNSVSFIDCSSSNGTDIYSFNVGCQQGSITADHYFDISESPNSQYYGTWESSSLDDIGYLEYRKKGKKKKKKKKEEDPPEDPFSRFDILDL